MIKISSYFHREALQDVIRRWMQDDPHPTDAARVGRLVHFNAACVSRYLGSFCELLLGTLQRHELRRRRALTKGCLKDAIIVNPPYRNARIDELVSGYKLRPELQYRETPFHGSLYFSHQEGREAYVGSNRIKRVRRLAEKSARRITDDIFAAIKREADLLADERARSLGIPREQLITPPRDMELEFARAESRLLDDLRNRRPIELSPDLAIADVAGLKVIADEGGVQRVIDCLGTLPRTEVLEVEVHQGSYNATNVIVRHKPDKDALVAMPPGPSLLQIMRDRGHDAAVVTREFGDFVRSAEEWVDIEVIVSTYQEMLESEIGRCMHEDRITAQRTGKQYRGYLARNIEYLVEYLFTVAASPQTEIAELPIKLWNRYLPDYFDEVTKGLYGIAPLRLAE